MPSKKTAKQTVVKDGPKPKFMLIGKGKYVHLFRTKAWDLKNSQCQQVRRAAVGDKINYKHKGLSPQAALDLETCTDCGVDAVAKRIIEETETPEDRKSRVNAKRDEVLDRAAGKKAKKASKVAKATAKPVEVEAKKPSMTKAGVRSVASSKDGDPSRTKAQLLANHGEENGWATSIEEDEHGWNVIAKRGEETIWAPFVDGKFDETRYGTLTVGSWTGKLRAAHACRRQMSCEGRDRPFPEPGRGRTGVRASKSEVQSQEEDSPEDASSRLPFAIGDEDELILDAIKGHVIRWRNGTSKSIEEGWVPAESKHTKITRHPKQPEVPGARILSFYHVDSVTENGEQYGPERHVRIDKIVRVG